MLDGLGRTLTEKQVELIEKVLEKGDRVRVFGKLRYSNWEHEGQKHEKAFLLLNRFELMQRNAKQEGTDAEVDSFDEDMPF